MRKKRWALLTGIVIFCIGFTLTISYSAGAAQKGKVTLVSDRSAFGMRGGDPHTNGGSVGMPVVGALYDALIQYAADGNFHPNLAKSWKIEPDWKYVTFNIDEEAKWTDGKAVTAADAKFSFERTMRKENDLKFV